MTRNNLSLGLESAKGEDSVTKHQESKKTSRKIEKKKAVPTYKQQQEKKDQEKEKDDIMTKFIELTSDEEEVDEDLPFLQSDATVKVRKRLRRTGWMKAGISDNDDSTWVKRKLKRGEANPRKMKRTEAQKTPRITRSSTSEKTLTHEARSIPNRSKKSPGIARKPSRTMAQALKSVKQLSKTTAPDKTSAKQGTSVAGVPKPSDNLSVSGQDSEAATFAGSVLFADQPQVKKAAADAPQAMVQPPPVTQAPVAPQSVKQTSVSPHTLSQASNSPHINTQTVQAATEPPVLSTPAQPWFQVPDALRSAIAQAVSQRQELLNSRMSRRQANQPDNNDSGCDPSNDEGERVIPNTLPDDQGRHAQLASNGYHNDQEPLAAKAPASYSASKAVVNPRKLSDRGSPAISRASSILSQPCNASRPMPSLVVGHIPPLLNFPRNNSEVTDIERKRAFLNAKKLAFEQFKWMRENELQQQEVELLRREMETREAFARKEIKLQRMSIRVDVIQRMVLVGASIEDIAEQLSLL